MWISETESLNLLPALVVHEAYYIEVDLDCVIGIGDSAGGEFKLILQFGLSLSASTKRRICTVIAAFPMLDLRGPAFMKDHLRQIFDIPQITSIKS